MLSIFQFKENGSVKKKAIYVILVISSEGYKEILGLYIGDTESSKHWFSVLNELKNRGVRDILIVCVDGLSGMKEAISSAFPNIEYQRYICSLS